MNLFELQAVLTLDSSGYTGEMGKVEQESNSFVGKIQGITRKAAGAWGTVKTAVQGVQTFLSPLIGMATDAVNAFGEYEQAVGGVKKLFGSATSTITANARKAFKDAGVSINDYMTLCIQSGATMLKSVGEDSAKAAELMDMAIIDMADNVNALGTDMTDVQNAYRGLSRGNFTMLDNLALGYAGSKEGMEELIADAEKLSGLKFDIGSYADIVRAIHEIQKYRGISGTSASEAATTQLGSKAAMEAAKQNMLIVLADSEATQQEKDEAAKAYADAMGQYIKNLLPVIKEALRSILLAIGEVIPTLLESLPQLVDFMVQLFTGILANTELVGKITTALTYAIVSALAGLIDILLTGLIRVINPNFATGSSAFASWGVYEWLEDAFGFSPEAKQRFKGFEKEQAEFNETASTFMETMGNDAKAWYDASRGVATIELNGVKTEFASFDEAIKNMKSLMEIRTGETPESEKKEKPKTFSYGGHEYELPEGDTEGQWLNFLTGWRHNVQPFDESYQLTPEDIQTLIKNFGGKLGEMNIPAQALTIDAGKSNVMTDTVTFTGGFTVNFGDLWDLPGSWDEDAEPHAKGLWDVPYDNYLASLHRDEMVLTASQAREYRNGAGGGSDAIVNAIRELRSDMTNLKIIVGQKAFGRTVVQYGGKRLDNFLGGAEDRVAAGYGWG